MIGKLTWTYLGKSHTVEVIEIEAQFDNEWFLRYRSGLQQKLRNGDVNHLEPLIRVKGNLAYHLTNRSANGELDWPEFETRGCKCRLVLY